MTDDTITISRKVFENTLSDAIAMMSEKIAAAIADCFFDEDDVLAAGEAEESNSTFLNRIK